MADTPEMTKPSSAMPYVICTLILFLIGVILIGVVLYLRPNADPVIVIGTVFGFLIASGTSIASFLKSQETHLTVNSQLTAWKQEFYAMSHAQGVISGTQQEQARIAEQARVLAETRRVDVVSPAPQPLPVPVSIVSPTPLPVEVKDSK